MGPIWLPIQYSIIFTIVSHLGLIFIVGLLIQYKRLHFSNSTIFTHLFNYLDSSEKIWKLFNFSILFHAILIGTPNLMRYLLADDVSEIKEVQDFILKNPSVIILPIEKGSYLVRGVLLVGVVFVVMGLFFV